MSPSTNQIANRSHVSGLSEVISQIEKMAPKVGTTGTHGQRKLRGRSGCRYRSTITATQTTTNASRMPILVSSAAALIGRNPAIRADAPR